MVDSSAPHKEDRRIQRTKQQLRDALMALVITRREWEPITIQDIADHANVSRTTFYLHFRDKEDLLFRSMEEVYNSLLSSVMVNIKTDPLARDPADFYHVQQYADFYRIMIGPKGSAAFIGRVERYLADVIHRTMLIPLQLPGKTPSIPLEAVAQYLAGAQIGLIRWWLDTGMSHTPDEMSEMAYTLCIQGLCSILPLTPPIGEQSG